MSEKFKAIRSTLGFAAAISAIMTASPSMAAKYRQTSAIELPRGSSADILRVDSKARRLYVGSGSDIQVFDIDTGNSVGSLTLPGSVTSIEIIPELGRLFATAKGGDVMAFDLVSMAASGRAKVSGTPTDSVYDAFTDRVFVVASEGNVTVLDPKSMKSLSKFAIGGELHDAEADGRGHLFVADRAAKSLRTFDTWTLRELGNMPTWPGGGPTAISNDTMERRIYVATDNGRLVIVDPDSGQTIGYVPTGQGVGDLAVNFMPNRFARMFVASADGKLTVIQNAKLTATVESEPDTPLKSTAVAVDTKTGNAYASGGGKVLVFGQ